MNKTMNRAQISNQEDEGFDKSFRLQISYTESILEHSAVVLL